MTSSLRQEFEDYAYFSVRVDRFFHSVNIYGRHHGTLKSAYDAIPPHEMTQGPLRDERIDEDFRHFCVAAISGLSYMGTTGIFSNEDELIPGKIPADMHNFAFYTCFCFQWNLFESFVKKMVERAIDSGALPPDVSGELRRKWRNTKKFLGYINSGRVLGRSPFVTLLPVAGWIPTMERCDYADLDKIRDLRNDFVHGVVPPEITDGDEFAKEKIYTRSMWILRQFASNVRQDVERLQGFPEH